MNEITYIGAHERIWRAKGKASNYMCGCGEGADEWAYTYDDPCPNEMVSPLGQKYSADFTRYVPMCRRCHRVYDKAVITHCPQGHEYAGENLIYDAGKRKCRTCVYKRNRDRSREFGLSPEQRKRKSDLQRERRAAAKRDAA